MDTTLPLSPPFFDEEWAVSAVLSCTDPRTVCKLALLNKTFHACSTSDLVWTHFLPPAHADHSASSKRDLYFRLCRSITIRDGNQRYWLDPATGSECHMLSAKLMSIAWGTTPQYWDWIPCSGSWFPQVALLREVCWFHVEGTFRQVLRPGKYLVSFRMQLRSAFGWDGCPVKLSLQDLSKGDQVESQRLFTRRFPRSDRPACWDQNDNIDASCDNNQWVECDVGEFTVGKEDKEDAVEVKFSMREIDMLGWKGGLFLDGAMVRPTHIIPESQYRAQAVLENQIQEEDDDDDDDDDDDEAENDSQASQHSQDDYGSQTDEGEVYQLDQAQDSVEGHDNGSSL